MLNFCLPLPYIFHECWMFCIIIIFFLPLLFLCHLGCYFTYRMCSTDIYWMNEWVPWIGQMETKSWCLLLKMQVGRMLIRCVAVGNMSTWSLGWGDLPTQLQAALENLWPLPGAELSPLHGWWGGKQNPLLWTGRRVLERKEVNQNV